MFIRHPKNPGLAFDGQKVYGLYSSEEMECEFVDEYGFAFDDEEFTRPACVAESATEVTSVEEFISKSPDDFLF